jgi:hypothetical protein
MGSCGLLCITVFSETVTIANEHGIYIAMQEGYHSNLSSRM